MKHLILLLLLSNQLIGQPQIKNLVFEGAGVRGIAYSGAISVLEEKDMIKDIEKVGGTSAGAITALLISIGYESSEIRQIISETKLHKFNDGKYLFVGGIYRLNKRFGWYRAKRFDKWLSKIIENKTKNPNITFKELSEKNFKDLYVTATCLNKQKEIVFGKDKYPKMMVKDAVKISMSIPLYFEAVFIDSIGTIHPKPKQLNKLDVVVDGGITANYPIFLFDTIVDGKRIESPHSLGFKIDREEQIKEDNLNGNIAPVPIHKFNDYVSALYNYVIESLNRVQLTEKDNERTIAISSKGISPKIKRLSKEQKQTLFQSGRDYSRNYLDKF